MLIISTLVIVCLNGCEYGDMYGSAANADLKLGLKVKPRELYAYRQGNNHFTGIFVFEFPVGTAKFFESPPSDFFNHPKPLSYEQGHTFITWRRMPVDGAHEFLKNRAEKIVSRGTTAARWKSEFEAAMVDRDNYYAVRYEDLGSGRYDNITFYVLDSSSRRLFEINDTHSFAE